MVLHRHAEYIVDEHKPLFSVIFSFQRKGSQIKTWCWHNILTGCAFESLAIPIGKNVCSISQELPF